MAAKKKPLDTRSAADLGVQELVGTGAAKIKVQKIYVPPKTQGAEILEGSATDVAEGLVAKIKELGLL
jgi:electron transfer flavoprotein alpha/beta subunit